MRPKEKADLAAYHVDINAARKKAIKEYVARLKALKALNKSKKP